MPVSYYNATTGSQTSTAGSGTLTLTLPTSAPSAGQWVFVAFMGNDPANVKPSVAKCGTVNLDLVDAGYVLTGSRVPVLYGAQMPSTGMTQSITITWTNTAGVSRSMYASAIVIGGAVTSGYTAFSVHSKYYNTLGLYDGTSNGLDVGTLASNGVTQATGSVLSWSSSAGIATSYDAQKQPFVLATWNGTGAAGYTAAQTINGATTIINGQPTTSGKAAGTITLTSASTYTVTPVYIMTPNGVCPITYSGVSGNDLVNCSVYGGSASGFYNYATNLNGAGVSINYPMLIQTASPTAAQPLNGWQMGINATTGRGSSIGTAGVTGVQAQGQLTLSFGQSSGLSSTPAYLVTSGAANPCGAVLVTLIPSTRTMTRQIVSTLVRNASMIRQIARRIVAVVVANSNTLRRVVRQIISNVVNVAKSPRTNTRRAIATLIRTTKSSRVSTRLGKATISGLASVKKLRIGNFKPTNVASIAISRQRRLIRAVAGANIFSVRSLRNAKKTAQATAQRSVFFTRTRNFVRTGSATVSNVSRVTRTRNYRLIGTVVTSYTIKSTKSKTLITRVGASVISIARATFRVIIHSRAGKVSIAFVTPSVGLGKEYASVGIGVETAPLLISHETANVGVDVTTAAVSISSGVKNPS